MADLYLIAHKVRGEPAFDVAEQIKCPVCEPIKQGLDVSSPNCDSCDDGHWWIIPTSGHRAYPYWNERLDNLSLLRDSQYIAFPDLIFIEMPLNLPDHYSCNDKVTSPKITQINLEELGL